MEKNIVPCVSVVIPVYNESRTIDIIIPKILNESSVLELIIIDDGSTDGSTEKIEIWKKRDSRVVFIKNVGNHGKGYSLRQGFKQVKGDIIILQDADLEYDPNSYQALILPIIDGSSEVVYGSRFLNNRMLFTPIWHRLGNSLLTWVSNLVSGLSLTDEATCYKVFKKDILSRFNLMEDGFGFCPEFTAKIARLGIKPIEIPISYHGRTRAEGKKIRFRHGIEAIWCIIKYNYF